MPISVICSQCQVELKVKDTLAAKRISCPKCNSAISVPEAEIVLDLEAIQPTPIEGDFTTWDFSSLSKETSNTEDLADDPFGLPAMEVADATAFPVATALPQNSNKPKSQGPSRQSSPANIRWSTIALVIGSGLMVMLFVLGAGVVFISSLLNNTKTGSIASERTTVPPSAQAAIQPQPQPPVQSSNVTETQPRNGDTTPAPKKSVNPPANERTGSFDDMARKGATVLIKMSATLESKSGTGLLIESNATDGYLVVSNALVTPSNGIPNEIKCIFFSGTSREFEAAASVAGVDEDAGLAILKILQSGLPPAVSIDRMSNPVEQMSIIAYGFPYADSVSSNGKHPPVSTTEGTVTAITKDKFGMITRFQMNHPNNTGDFGGPVFDENGSLLGFASPQQGTTEGEESVIPQTVFSDSFYGRVHRVRKGKSDLLPNQSLLSLQLLDPRNSIESVTIYSFAARDQIAKKPNRDGKWEIASNKILSKSDCQMQWHMAGGKASTPPDVDDVMLQYCVKRKDGSQWISEPSLLATAPEAPASLAESKQRTAPKPEQTASSSSSTRAPSNASEDVVAPSPSNSATTDSSATPPSSANSANLANPTPPDKKDGGRLVKLPVSMARFIINPENGDIAAVSPLVNEAVLYRAPDYSVADIVQAPFSENSRPISIVYKKFGDARYYAVVCSNDISMYLIDPKDFRVVKEVRLDGYVGSDAAVSQNEKDPFIYFCYRDQHEYAVGAVDLRKMTTVPVVVKNLAECVISADGTMMYGRGNYIPSGFLCKKLRNSFEDDKPIFRDHYSEHRDSRGYIADPHGEYTISGEKIYSKSLRVQHATFSFMPSCFMRNKPVILGTRGYNIAAVSYNSLTEYQTAVKINSSHAPNDDKPQYAGIPPDTRNWEEAFRSVVLADEVNNRVICASYDELFIVPFSMLNLPDEPRLTVDFSPNELRAGTKHKIVVTPNVEGTEVSFEGLPKGAVADKGTIEWTPTDDQVGSVAITTHLKSGATERTIKRNLDISQPYIESPIDIYRFVYAEDEGIAVCWARDGLDHNDMAMKQSDNNGKATKRIAVLPFKRGEQVQTIEHTETIRSVLPFGKRLAVLYARDPLRVDIFERSTMKRIKTLLTQAPIQTVKTDNETLLVISKEDFEQTLDVYQSSTLKKLRSTQLEEIDPTPSSYDDAFKDGVINSGILMDTQKYTPRLIVHPGRIPQLPGADQNLLDGQFLRKMSGKNTEHDFDEELEWRLSHTRIQGPQPIPNKPLLAELHTDRVTNVSIDPEGLKDDRYLVFLILKSPTTNEIVRIPIIDQEADRNVITSKPFMQILNDFILVSVGNKIYRWKIPSSAKKNDRAVPSSNEFYIEPQQSAFVVKGTKQSLKHVVHGGEKPYAFAMISPANGVSVNASTGVVSMDLDTIAEAAKGLMSIKPIDERQDTDTELNRILSSAHEHYETVSFRVSEKLQGFPVAVPIHFKVADAAGNVAEIQYFVVVDISTRQIRKLLQQK